MLSDKNTIIGLFLILVSLLIGYLFLTSGISQELSEGGKYMEGEFKGESFESPSPARSSTTRELHISPQEGQKRE